MTRLGRTLSWFAVFSVAGIGIVGERAALAAIPPHFRGMPNSVFARMDQDLDPIIGGSLQMTHVELYRGDFLVFPIDASVTEGEVGGNIVITIPNFVDPLPIMLMRINIECNECSTIAPPTVEAFDPLANSVLLMDDVEVDSINRYFDFEVRPNPDWERITFFGVAGDLSAVEVDTLSSVVPIPAALPLFSTALASLGVIGWRRRKAA